MDIHALGFGLAGLAAVGAAAVPRLTHGRPVSLPMIAVAFGLLVFALPLGFAAPDPLAQRALTEWLTELVVIIALTGAGLKLDRPFGRRRWTSASRLLAVVIPLTVAGVALLGWGVLGLSPAAAVLLGAALAPTDPVLATEVQVGPPTTGEAGQETEDEVRFGLTAEAGLNDGLAFPFINAAIAMATVGVAPSGWLGEWFRVDVLREVIVGIVAGFVVGRLLAKLVFRRHRGPAFAESREGLVALGLTFLSYGAAEALGGYGFLAVFVAALAIRRSERSHEYHEVLHEFVEQAERGLTMILLLGFGGAIAGGLLAPLGWTGALVAVIVVLALRPAAGAIALIGRPVARPERLALAFFGVKGIGSFYYLAYGLGAAEFAEGEAALLWAVAGAVVLVSIVVHGITAAPILGRIDRHRSALTGEGVLS